MVLIAGDWTPLRRAVLMSDWPTVRYRLTATDRQRPTDRPRVYGGAESLHRGDMGMKWRWRRASRGWIEAVPW